MHFTLYTLRTLHYSAAAPLCDARWHSLRRRCARMAASADPSGEDRDTKLTKILDRLFKKSVLKEADELKIDEIRFLMSEATNVLRHNTALEEIDPPVVICGDMHGQYEDLIRIMKRQGWPPHTRYLFLGDYVDRGTHSIETICTIFAIKAAYPSRFFAIRGNHETKEINQQYGLHEECERRFPGEKLWDALNEVFLWLPVAAIVGERIFCVHGGISRELDDLEQIRSIKLPTGCPDTGIIADLLWSDPSDTTFGFIASNRGQGHLFGADALERFCQHMDIDLVCRAHQVHAIGYRLFGDERLITIFSAPNYGGFNNDGACVIVDQDMKCCIKVLPPSGRKRSHAVEAHDPNKVQ